MIKRTVTFKDFDGNEQTQDLWFHLTQKEAFEIVGEKGNWEDFISELTQKPDFKRVISTANRIILDAYGERIDGKFKKSPEIRNDFEYSEAFSKLFFDLLGDGSDGTAFGEFIGALSPSDATPIDKPKVVKSKTKK